jgi:hypothetical protein
VALVQYYVCKDTDFKHLYLSDYNVLQLVGFIQTPEFQFSITSCYLYKPEHGIVTEVEHYCKDKLIKKLLASASACSRPYFQVLDE